MNVMHTLTRKWKLTSLRVFELPALECCRT